MNKKEIRSHIKALKTAVSMNEIRDYSEKIKECLLMDKSYLNCTHLFCYVSFHQEVLTAEIINSGIANSKKVAVPKIVDNEMKFYYIESFADLQPGILGIPEPVSGIEAIPDKKNNNLVIVPGLAFDWNKNRVGYGKGYYDRFFEKYKSVPMKTIALSYDFQVFEQIPQDEHDKKVDQIITNTKIII
ncbi:MAG: 5-formyltetrahydrofolate cyclo-ligase family protein [Anaerocolumna sp.]|jgi:5-formyltetrahydrofolate cyclo-ligase|nr:5-formyltetrahydrofolate cyclo-ligase family protein [Anaerocolumna sp.]